MQTKSKEQYQEDALKLFRSMGSFGISGRVTTGETENTPNVIREILSNYTNKADLQALEEAYEKIYLDSGSVSDLLGEDPGKKVTFAEGLKGEFEGQERLVKRLKGLIEGEEDLSLLELDLKDEGTEYAGSIDDAERRDNPIFQNPFKAYQDAKKEKPDSDPRIEEYQEYLDSLPDDDPFKESFINQPAIAMSVEEEINQYKNNDDLLKAYEDKKLSPDAVKFVDMLLRNVDEEPSELPTDKDEITDVVDGGGDPDSDPDPDPETETEKNIVENNTQPKTYMQGLGELGDVISKGLNLANTIRNNIQGPDDLMLAALGQQAYAESMRETMKTDLPGLSSEFIAHLHQVKQLAKKGFGVAEAAKARKDIDSAYKKGIETAVRGTSGDRAKFLAMSGVLDEQRASALLEFATKDAELNRSNQDAYTKALSFAEEFEANRSANEKTMDLQLELKRKEGASNFAKEAFASLNDRMSPAGEQYLYQLQNAVQNFSSNPYNLELTLPPYVANTSSEEQGSN